MQVIFELFPQLADAVHVWGLAIADAFRQFNIDFPPAWINL
ncbi:hypothetical protein [Corynebacterium pelargi]|uniref:Uncharacterized protein n=1 Tax=Corynebacterium pelargi TaxID=1471400 RepID=A0A410W7Z6_9CORY|nr:hypothetical protein [Corynebacterium pelargi]QAU52064.1 hypothetical protein CPELA_03925 [Corynebacterium pelargi]GGG70393.1 hypothetical protein GCM10007338_04120 [Corynebacterium pelargi]